MMPAAFFEILFTRLLKYGIAFALAYSWGFGHVPATAAEPRTDREKKAVVYQMYAEYKKDFPEIIDIDPLEAMALQKRGEVVFVDTRTPAEMQVSMLPDAIGKSVFQKQMRRYTDRKIVAYCTISYRSGLFAAEMARQGITIYNLRGGILAWTLEGGKVYNGKKPVKRIHVYGEKWNFPPKGYKSVLFGFFEKLFNSRPRENQGAAAFHCCLKVSSASGSNRRINTSWSRDVRAQYSA